MKICCWCRHQNVLKTSWICFEDVLARRLGDVFKRNWWRLENILNKSWRYLEGTFCKTSERRLENVLKTSWRSMTKTNILVLSTTSWRRLEDLLKTSSEVVWRRKIYSSWLKRVADVFWRRRRRWKTSSRRLHQDECLLG